ncbi:MAG: galactokinase [Bacteroidetes bacterium]|nr:galactokinase [Bacteroidota bacterium]MBS1641285.1 galactokinase [Bacteroidota bacterium]MBS1670649.1 galactokinase [Bacteroidota bacterium]
MLTVQKHIKVKSPGRINLIGEHTDYNNGFVLPAAIDKYIYIDASLRNDDVIELFSVDNNQSYTTTTNTLLKSSMHWPDYVLGVVNELQKAGYITKGFNASIHGDIPIGAGLSSSAALECATIFALNELNEFGIDRITMVKLCQKAENNFVGLQCGIMDMFASMMGKANHVIRLDCRSLEYEYFPLQLNDYKIVLLDTQVKHSLASSEYNTRRKECNEGVALIQQKHNEVKSLREANIEMVHECIENGNVKNRCTFIVEEKKRLLNGCIDLQNANVQAFGKKMYATHTGLSELYKVSCNELDFLVNECSKEEKILGARMMGGGFGGCVISLMHQDFIEPITQKIATAYKEQMQKNLKVYIATIGDGTSVIKE